MIQTNEQIVASDFITLARYGTDSVGSDSYAITSHSPITAYVLGQKFRFKAGTANTGACSLSVDGLGAVAIKKNVSEDLVTGDILANQIVEVVYDGTNMQIVSLPTIIKEVIKYNQQISLPTLGYIGCGASQDGSAFYLMEGSNGDNFKRYEKDSNTGMYFLTHTVNPTFVFDNHVGIIQIGSYVYVFGDDNTNIKAVRFLASNLSGETNMTVPVAPSNNQYLGAWTDGTYAYMNSSNGTGTVSYKWSVSGTTFSYVSTGTVTSNIFFNINSCSAWNGTNAYILDVGVSPTLATIRKITTLDGSAYTTTTKEFQIMGDGNNRGAILIPISSNMAYIGKIYDNFNATVGVGSTINLVPITLP